EISKAVRQAPVTENPARCGCRGQKRRNPMLGDPDRTNIPSTNGGQDLVKKISGHQLLRSRQHLSVSHLALLAADLEAGKVEMSRFPRSLAAAATGVSSGYISTAKKLSVEQRAQVERGKSISAFHNNHQEMTDAAIDRFIAKAGAMRVMNALDRYT